MSCRIARKVKGLGTGFSDIDTGSSCHAMGKVLYEFCILQVLSGREYCNIEFAVGIDYVCFWPGAAKRRSGVNQLIQPAPIRQFVSLFRQLNLLAGFTQGVKALNL